jgi:hypothetical protein
MIFLVDDAKVIKFPIIDEAKPQEVTNLIKIRNIYEIQIIKALSIKD